MDTPYKKILTIFQEFSPVFLSKLYAICFLVRLKNSSSMNINCLASSAWLHTCVCACVCGFAGYLATMRKLTLKSLGTMHVVCANCDTASSADPTAACCTRFNFVFELKLQRQRPATRQQGGNPLYSPTPPSSLPPPTPLGVSKLYSWRKRVKKSLMQNWLTVTKYKKQRTVKRNTKLVTVAADFSAPKPRPGNPLCSCNTAASVPIPFQLHPPPRPSSVLFLLHFPHRQAGRLAAPLSFCAYLCSSATAPVRMQRFHYSYFVLLQLAQPGMQRVARHELKT